HKSNYYIDLSGWAPKYFPAELVHNVNTLIQDKALFGSDWPAITPERWISEFNERSFKPEVRRKILLDNARRLFKLPQGFVSRKILGTCAAKIAGGTYRSCLRLSSKLESWRNPTAARLPSTESVSRFAAEKPRRSSVRASGSQSNFKPTEGWRAQ